jgi:hypothetical protein
MQGVDCYGIQVVVQHGVKQVDLPTLVQRFGRGARGPGETCHCIVLYESQYSDQTWLAAAERAKNPKKRKRAAPSADSTEHAADGGRPKKRRKTRAAANPLAAHAEVVLLAEKPQNEREELLQRKYHQAAAQAQDKGSVQDLDPAMDDFINAPHRGFSCRRYVLDLVFGNHRFRSTADHTKCDPYTLGGCERCRPKMPSVCCDIHAPAAFDIFDFTPAPTKVASTRKLPVKAISADDAEDVDNTLSKALHHYRQDMATKLFPRSLVVQLGPLLFMTNGVLDRIAGLARSGKLTSVKVLARQVEWRYSAKYGPAVLDLVRKTHPHNVETAAPVADATTDTQDNSAVPTSSGRKPMTCKACGGVGHRSALLYTRCVEVC